MLFLVEVDLKQACQTQTNLWAALCVSKDRKTLMKAAVQKFVVILCSVLYHLDQKHIFYEKFLQISILLIVVSVLRATFYKLWGRIRPAAGQFEMPDLKG